MQLPLDEQNIIKILGIESLPDDRKAVLVDQMTDLVQKRLLLRILDSFSDAQRTKFEVLIDENDQEKLNDFLAASAPKLGDWLVEEVNQIKQEMAGIASNIP